MLFNYFVIFVALSISTVAAVYSISGLMSLFAGAATGVMIMGIVLELGKIVTAVWLHHYWDDLTRLLKVYLTLAVIVLMGITSLGIFGYLSRAHLEQGVKQEILSVKNPVAIFDIQINAKNVQLKDIENRISQLDTAIARLRANAALEALRKESKNREAIVNEKMKVLEEITDLKSKKAVAEITQKAEEQKLELEVGPLRYVADFVFGKADHNQLEQAVRWVIFILIIVFDPLAIFLLVGATIKLRKPVEPVERIVYRKKVGRPLGSKNKPKTILDENGRRIQVRAGNSSVQILDPPAVDLTKFNP